MDETALGQDTVVVDSGNAQKVERVIHALRKPEVRSPFTDVLLQTAREYYEPILSGDSEQAQQFREDNGFLLFAGSIAKGTAAPGSSDVDFFVCYDEETQKQQWKKYDDLFSNSERAHPEGLTFKEFFYRKLKNDPELEKYIAERKRLFEYRQETANERRIQRGEEPIHREFDDGYIEQYIIVNPDIACMNTAVLQDFIANGNVPEGRLQEIQELVELGVVSVLLTTTPDFTIESAPGVLSGHQRRFVEALKTLKQNDPNRFVQLYTELEKGFKSASFFPSENHKRLPEYTNVTQLKDYAQRSGRFEDPERATRILSGIRAQLTFPAIEDFDAYYSRPA